MHNPDIGAAAICVVRNPLDVTVSITYNFGLSMDEAIDYLGNENVATKNDAPHVSQLLGSWSQHVASWTSEPAPTS